MKFFYEKEYYQNVYRTWTIKKAILVLLAIGFIMSFLFGVKVYWKINKYTDVAKISDFCQSLPKVWSFTDGEGLIVQEDANSEPISAYRHEYFKIDTTKQVFSQADFTDISVILGKTNLAINLSDNRAKEQGAENIQYFPIDKLEIQGIKLNSLRLEVASDSILSFQNGQFSRKITFFEISKAMSKFLRIFFAIIFFLGGFVFFITFLGSNFVFSFVMTKIINRKEPILETKKVFISLAPASFVVLIAFFIFGIFLNISVFIILNMLLTFYGIFVPIKFLR